MTKAMGVVNTRSWQYLFVKYFKWHLSLIYRIYGDLILKFNSKPFCIFFNLAAKLRNVDIQIYFDQKSKRYSAISDQYKLHFYHPKQAHMAYHKGIDFRAIDLAESYLLHKINFVDGDVVVDCGANVGDLKLYFRKKNILIEYIGFEPSPLEYECLKMNVQPSETHNIGLWHEDNFLSFYVSSEGADSSFIEPPKYDEIKKIPTRRLDRILNKNIKLLKVEAEGAEPEVLFGCEDLLSRIQYISADLGCERGIEQVSTLAPVVNYLLSKNFELIEVNHSRINALFKNKSFQI